jgi:hypothetical protein
VTNGLSKALTKGFYEEGVEFEIKRISFKIT